MIFIDLAHWETEQASNLHVSTPRLKKTYLKTLEQRFSACNRFKSCRVSSSNTFVFTLAYKPYGSLYGPKTVCEGTSELRIL